MKFVTNLVFGGQCREAFERYAAIFGGSITQMIPFASAPIDNMPDRLKASDGIMHAWLEAGEQSLMGCDSPDGEGQPAGGFSASYHCADIEEGRRVFDLLADQGRVTKPFGATFFSPGFGMLTDRFGIPWLVNTNPRLPA